MLVTGLKLLLSTILIVGLAFFSGLLSILLYFKVSGKEPEFGFGDAIASAAIQPLKVEPIPADNQPQQPAPKEIKKKMMIDAPLVLQNPELPSGCELVSLTMLLQFYGIKKGKMDLLPEMKVDTTPLQRNKDGTIAYWGNPNSGYVGDITGKKKGFGIYHAALFDLLAKYVPSAADLTGTTFNKLEEKVSEGIPVVVWTTIPFTVPNENQWVVWDSPLGPIKTTFIEHAVLLVGYDEEHVYVNDPLSGRKQYQIEKQRFIKTWDAMGRQALTYTKKEA
ncbi:hypothetical protein GK047_21685 [Paenibacillus sp. SYP-B3998]|uniref:Peptidase C39-like domain-containing protein n=1 Tax=Paenibacillus sp. SYP-B3998 TaxID=2678564 RepID=A0A6G4A467_9BACL|nr:C39 family peptidase [Paenibacillus sp. SYP-B3998]NEW08611.1 hypothetical protein [Paenibacillus sp. SYP-B3998]